MKSPNANVAWGFFNECNFNRVTLQPINNFMNHHQFKIEIYHHCERIIHKRLETIKSNLVQLMESKQNETKSSAGDKYETGMAMIQNEEDLYKRQLANTQQILVQFQKIDASKQCVNVQPGALIKLPAGWFYMGAAMGKITVNDIDVYCISLQSPLGGALKNLHLNEKVCFNEQCFTISELY